LLESKVVVRVMSAIELHARDPSVCDRVTKRTPDTP